MFSLECLVLSESWRTQRGVFQLNTQNQKLNTVRAAYYSAATTASPISCVPTLFVPSS